MGRSDFDSDCGMYTSNFSLALEQRAAGQTDWIPRLLSTLCRSSPAEATLGQSHSFQRYSTFPVSTEHLEAYSKLDLSQHIHSPLNSHTQWPLRSVPLCCRASCWPSALPWLCAPSTPRPLTPFFLHCPRSSRAPVRDDFQFDHPPTLTQANSQRCCHCPRRILRTR